jgi:hypothetical protein
VSESCNASLLLLPCLAKRRLSSLEYGAHTSDRSLDRSIVALWSLIQRNGFNAKQKKKQKSRAQAVARRRPMIVNVLAFSLYKEEDTCFAA